MLMNLNLHKKLRFVSTPASPVFKGLVTEHRTVKLSIDNTVLTYSVKPYELPALPGEFMFDSPEFLHFSKLERQSTSGVLLSDRTSTTSNNYE